MLKKISLNVILLITTYLIPYSLLSFYQTDTLKMQSIQTYLLAIIFIGAAVHFYLNHKFRRQALNKKWVWVIFEILGIVGVIFSSGILFLIYSFRNFLT